MVNCVSFATIASFIEKVSQNSINIDIVVRNIAANLLIFIPMGMTLPVLFEKKFDKCWKLILFVSILVLVIEAIQFATFMGSTDIDDLSLIIRTPPSQREAKKDAQEYSRKFYNTELTGWNDGVFDVRIIGEDNDLYIYQKPTRKKMTYGLIGKRYIQSIEPIGKIYEMDDWNEQIDREYFCDKPVRIELAHKRGFVKGFLDFRNDDYRNVVIQKFTTSEILLRYGQNPDIAEVCIIELLDD